jgi:hypothetical protein
VLTTIVAGGQTGVDQAALRAAERLGLARGGWCPPGRACESGRIPDRFSLVETPHEHSAAAPDVPRSLRTEWNVRDADATLVLTARRGAELGAGTAWAARCAAGYGRPLLVVALDEPGAAAAIADWLAAHSIRTLNVAGPSEGEQPGIGERAERLLVGVLAAATSP